jgi:preprotein translocase subunit SecB
LSLVRRPNLAMQEINFAAIYDNNMAEILTIGFNQ